MKAAIRLEVFGDDTRQYLRLQEKIADEIMPGVGRVLVGKAPPPCWVAEITGTDKKYGLARSFLEGAKDYSQANGIGSRGVYFWYTLESGKYYEVRERVSWKRFDKYFVTVSGDGDVKRVNKEEVEEWLKSLSE